MIRSDALKLARSFKAKLIAEGYPVRQVYLFGSQAKGTARPTSDVDVVVVCDPFLPSKHDENMALRRVRRGIDRRIEPIALRREELDDPYLTLAREVKAHGIQL